jgi:transcriptional regulator with XRE-family HTH domain
LRRAYGIRLKDDGWLPKAMALKGFKNQTALADAMGVNRSTVSRALSDKQKADHGMSRRAGAKPR